MNLYETEKLKYQKMHAVPGYSLGPGASHTRAFMAYLEPGDTVIDFGCGTGDAGRILADHGFKVVLVDLVKDPVRHADLPFVQASLHELPEDLPRASWGFCCDVMEHLPTAWIDQALAAMRSRVPNCFFSISGAPDGWGRHINDTLHLTVRPASWWAVALENHWGQVRRLGQSDVVFEFICRA